MPPDIENAGLSCSYCLPLPSQATGTSSLCWTLCDFKAPSVQFSVVEALSGLLNHFLFISFFSARNYIRAFARTSQALDSSTLILCFLLLHFETGLSLTKLPKLALNSLYNLNRH